MRRLSVSFSQKTVMSWLFIIMILGQTLLACTPEVNLSSKVISPQNASRLVELEQWGKGTLQEVIYSPDGKLIAFRSGIGVYFFNALTFKQVRFIKEEGAPVNMAFSNDSKILALVIIPFPEDIKVKLYNVDTGREIRVLTFSCGGMDLCGTTNAIFSPDDKTLAIAGPSIQLWSIGTGRKIRTISEMFSDTVAFSSDGKLLAGSGEPGTLKTWNVETGEEMTILGKPHKGTDAPIPINIIFSLDKTGLIVEYMPNWHISTCSLENGQCTSMPDKYTRAISPDQTKAASFPFASNTVTVYDLQDASKGTQTKIFTNHSDYIDSATFSSDATRLITTSDDDTVKVWDIATGKELHTFYGFSDEVESIALSPDQKLLAVGAGGSYNKWILLLDAHTGQEIRWLDGHNDIIFDLDFSPDGTRLASASRDGTAKIWDITTGREVYTSEKAGIMFSVNFSPDGKMLAMTNGQGIFAIDVTNQSEVYTLQANLYTPDSNAFSPDGNILAWSNGDSIFLLNTYTGQKLSTIQDHGNSVRTVLFSPDGKLVATVFDGNIKFDRNIIKVWDVSTKHNLHTIDWHYVMALAFSPDSCLLAASSLNGDIKIWDISSGRELTTLKGHSSVVSDILFSPDGTRLYSASWDGTVIVWGVQ